jgi:hypothetical protein
MIRQYANALVLAALGELTPTYRDPFVCFAASDYATEGGADDQSVLGEDGQWYRTVGAEDVGAAQSRSAPLARRPLAAVPQRPAPRPMQFYRPTAAPGAAGLSEAQVRSIVAAELARRVPYGDVPTRPSPDEAMFPMGLGSVTLITTNTIDDLTAQPQRAFRGERLVLSVFRSTGAVGIPVVITQFQIGDYKQLVGGGALPVEVFASDAFGVRLMLDASIPGVLYDLQVQALAAIPGGETIIISGAVIGRAGEAASR